MLQLLGSLLVLVEYALKIAAIGTIPENRNPSSSSAWLLLILFVPIIGFPLYWVLGSRWVKGRRRDVQNRANQLVADMTSEYPDLPPGVDSTAGLASIVHMNRNLTGMPAVTGVNHGLFDDTDELVAAMVDAVASATRYVHVQFYILNLDDTTSPLIDELAEASARGVRVRVLADHMGSRKYPGWKALQRRLADAGIEMHLMLPIQPLRGSWRRPDLRNHRKLLVVDGETAFVGSHNLIHPAYGSAKNVAAGREWHDLSMQVTGDVVQQIEAVFAMDWFIESGERLGVEADFSKEAPQRRADPQTSSSWFRRARIPNRAQSSDVHLADPSGDTRGVHRQPYFVPDEALLGAITSAAIRGVDVELYVGEESDQFLVGHAQRSFYHALLDAGVRIFLYPAPLVLHSKYLTVDDEIGVIGSSNMDYRSFALNFETMLLGFGGDLVGQLQAHSARYRSVSAELTLEEWLEQPWFRRYVDNVARLAAAVM